MASDSYKRGAGKVRQQASRTGKGQGEIRFLAQQKIRTAHNRAMTREETQKNSGRSNSRHE
jgi:hypothetical protein